eukprot:TRINITY_DN18948_c0_g1_i1.p1 TRINITY_DN18948_c0_g1~~TRINITY_DN18948_c0_g1_i1.p1  ORF type:complete len:444 (-),score=59.23 TRINITY_DN18948_c0_g1_i1:198-1529(-)
MPFPGPSSVEIPAAGFPGETGDETQKLFASRRQPESLECWPRNKAGGWYGSCDEWKVLEDSQYGWPAYCQDLVAKSGPEKNSWTHGIPKGETCETECIKSPDCSVWVVVNDSAQACWHGQGSNCYQRAGFPGVRRAQRIMHGKVRVLANLTTVQLWGLKKAFDSNYFVHQLTDGVAACRNHCYSNIGCQYWQYSSVTGCWTEEPNLEDEENEVAYPLTRHEATNDTRMAKFILAGEYIQHVCPGRAGVPTSFSAAFTPNRLEFVAPPTDPYLVERMRIAYPSVRGAPTFMESAALSLGAGNSGPFQTEVTTSAPILDMGTPNAGNQPTVAHVLTIKREGDAGGDERVVLPVVPWGPRGNAEIPSAKDSTAAATESFLPRWSNCYPFVAMCGIILSACSACAYFFAREALGVTVCEDDDDTDDAASAFTRHSAETDMDAPLMTP